MTRTLKIVTYNVHSCIGGDRQCKPDRVLAVLREIGADIIALQEVGAPRQDEIDQFHHFERHLEMTGVSGPNVRRGKNQFGNAVFTRGKFTETGLVDLSVQPFEPRGAIDCQIEIDGRDLRVVATHLGLFPHERRQQMRRLATALATRESGLTVLLGDFNVFGPERRNLRTIGAPEKLPKLRTFPSRRPIMSLDRVWTLPNARLVSLEVHRTALSKSASDHLPLVATVDLRQAAPAAHRAEERVPA